MKIRTRIFLLGLLPTLLVAMVLTVYHLHTRLAELEATMGQQGMAMARHLASSAEYGVFSGNTAVLGKLLDQAMAEPGVESAVVIWPDQARLERIVRNLLSNALRHTQHGGVLLSARPCQGKLRLQVWDTGSGIAPENQPRVFDEFYQAETQDAQVPHGLGLGLAIVRRLARLLGYPLQLHSRLGQGTVFSLDVPVLANGPADIDEAVGDSSGVLKGCAVVVDDDPVILNALGQLLQQWGMDVRPFHSLHQVVHQLQAAPDLVLVDYQLLNGETGLMVANDVHTRWGAHIPVVLITGDTRTETIRALRQNGFQVLHKPVRANQLRALLTMLLMQERSVLRIDG